MKKAKIMLSVLVVIAVSAGVLAFKAREQRGSTPIATCDQALGVCVTTVIVNSNRGTLVAGTPGIFTTYFQATLNPMDAGLNCGSACTTTVFMIAGN